MHTSFLFGSIKGKLRFERETIPCPERMGWSLTDHAWIDRAERLATTTDSDIVPDSHRPKMFHYFMHMRAKPICGFWMMNPSWQQASPSTAHSPIHARSDQDPAELSLGSIFDTKMIANISRISTLPACRRPHDSRPRPRRVLPAAASRQQLGATLYTSPRDGERPDRGGREAPRRAAGRRCSRRAG